MRKLAVIILLVSVASVFPGCVEEEHSEISSMLLSSSAFENGGVIPMEYTCDGTDVSPPLNFSGTPENAESLVLIMYDPDAPSGTFTHWLVWNIPVATKGFSEGEKIVYPQGTNGFGVTGYRGPCPPSGATHRYFFKIYALDTKLDLKPGATREQLENAMSGHILAEGQLMGTYSR
ncbi:MAG TPA: YbhB/YbcL family Raf kinase inhibitor-like protein [Thermoplasmatales archaeon]|nr:YbhB/YbcL family Raf kinase inhibitor-like protein [Thermoplasmatales archaeon]